MALTTRCPRAWFTIAPRYQHRDYAIEAVCPLVRCLSARGKPGSGAVATCGMPAEQGRRSLHAQWLSLVAATAQRAADMSAAWRYVSLWLGRPDPGVLYGCGLAASAGVLFALQHYKSSAAGRDVVGSGHGKRG